MPGYQLQELLLEIGRLAEVYLEPKLGKLLVTEIADSGVLGSHRVRGLRLLLLSCCLSKGKGDVGVWIGWSRKACFCARL